MGNSVVISGVGAVSAMGIGVGPLWDAMTTGRSGLGAVDLYDLRGFPSRFGGQVPGADVRSAVPKGYRKAAKVMARDSELAVIAAQLAARDARVLTRGSAEAGDLAADPKSATPIDLSRAGCQIGAGQIAAETQELTAALSTARDELGRFSPTRWGTEGGGDGGMNNLPPLWLLKYLPNMLACHVTIIHGLEGPSNTITCAEPSGLLCVGEAARVIERGDADLCFAGGIESKLNPMGLTRLHLLGRLANANAQTSPQTGPLTDPALAWTLVRPFDPAATGSLAGEGGAIFVVESADHAAARGATPYATVAGFGAGQSTRHVFAGPLDPPPPGLVNAGLERAVRAALADAAIGPADIDAIAPAAMGIPAADLPEAGALAAVFGPRLPHIELILTAPYAGAVVAGMSALQLAAAAMAIRSASLPARIHAGSPAPGLLAGPAPARPAAIRHALVCGSSLGGQAAAVVLRAP